VPEQEIFCQLPKKWLYTIEPSEKRKAIAKRKVFHLLKKPEN
jgi:hypothetical protein